MLKYGKESNMSELEMGFELDMQEEPAEKDELEAEYEQLADIEEEPPEELEAIEEPADFAERFFELSTREWESETEVDDAVNGLLNEMEREYFFKGLWKKIKKGGKWLLKKGIKLAKGLPVFQVVKGITQLASGNLKGMLSALAKAGLAAVPGGSVALPALQALGFKETEFPEENRDAWINYVGVCREAFDHLATHLNEDADDPAEASKLATEAFQAAIKAAPAQSAALARKGKRREVLVRKGETVVIRVRGI